MSYVFNTSEFKRYKFPTHINDLVIDRANAMTSEVFVVIIEPGKAPPPHIHDDTEQLFYVLDGKGVLTIGDSREKHPVGPGDMVLIPPSTLHSIEAQGDKDLKYLAIDCFVKGRPEAEPTWDTHARVMCRNNGWNYEDVMKASEESLKNG